MRRVALHRKRISVPWLTTAFLVAVLLNFAWEMAQAYLYQPMGTVWEATRRCLIASVGDGGMILLVLVMARRLTDGPLQTIGRREYALIIALAVAIAIAVEWWGLAAGRWAYRAQMPKLPGTQLGLVPMFQMAALAPLTLWLADHATRTRAGR